MSNPYLIAAYAFTAVLFALYAWSLVRRKTRLLHELEAIRKRVSGQ